MATTTHPYRTATPIERPRPVDQDIARLRTFAKIFDGYMLDPILGFILPGVGDLVGSMMGLWIVAVAGKKGIAPVVIARMLLNLALDAVIGVVPLLGDIGDMAFKANSKNLALLEDRASTRRGTRADWAWVIGAGAVFVVAIGVVLWLAGRVLSWLYTSL